MMPNNSLNIISQELTQTRRKTYDFAKFQKFYFGHYHKNPAAPFHAELSKLLSEAADTRGRKLAIAAPRGSAKSTIITLEYVIFAICRHTDDFIVIISNTAEQAASFLSCIKAELETNELLRKDFPEVCELGKKPEPLRWSMHEIITKNNIKVTALGVGQNIRGKRHNQHRPTLVILDDIEGNEATQNEDNRYKLKDWLEKSVLKAGSAFTNFIFTGTIHHYDSLLAQYTNPQEAPGWKSIIYRSVIRWSEEEQAWQLWRNIYRSKQEYNGQLGAEAALAYFTAHKEQMLAGTEALWPATKSYYDLMVMREQDGEISFDSEMQNEPVNPRDCCFNLADITYWDDTHKNAMELLRTLRNPYFFMACDPSLGRDYGDYTAILVGVKSDNSDIIYVIEADITRRQPDDIINALISHAKSWGALYAGIESNTFQMVLINQIDERSKKENLRFCTTPIQNSSNKLQRIQSLQPLLKLGKLQFCRAHKTLLDQLKCFPKGRHDDGPDALEMLWQIGNHHYFQPSDIRSATDSDTEEFEEPNDSCFPQNMMEVLRDTGWTKNRLPRFDDMYK